MILRKVLLFFLSADGVGCSHGVDRRRQCRRRQRRRTHGFTRRRQGWLGDPRAGLRPSRLVAMVCLGRPRCHPRVGEAFSAHAAGGAPREPVAVEPRACLRAPLPTHLRARNHRRRAIISGTGHKSRHSVTLLGSLRDAGSQDRLSFSAHGSWPDVRRRATIVTEKPGTGSPLRTLPALIGTCGRRGPPDRRPSGGRAGAPSWRATNWPAPC